MNIQEFDTEDTRDIDTSDNADALGNVPDSIIEQALRPIVDASTSVAVPAQHADVTSHNPDNDAGQPMNKRKPRKYTRITISGIQRLEGGKDRMNTM